MNSLVVLVACLAAASASYAGAYHGAYGWAGHGYPYSSPYAYAGHGYHGPIAIPHVLPSGYLADTPEVAAAKGAHLSAVAAASHRSGSYGPGYGYGYGHGYGHGYGYGHGAYHGPLAVPHVLPSGYLADTPDVAAVKASHLTAVAAQGGATHNYAHGYSYGHAYPHYGHGYYHH
ncbi:shematrin-like protein 1 [Macrosteles quadrilineatus]|uniref:shematrin-like protein 1 n=1 Tax=Macrosteles quadrilineatus TaxID=74068 RepID=UPI0023E2D0DC|nr:shematrin-like protein 1 [Macrosteles quadrilineatus]